MASTQDLKRRVRSISNTRKLTRAMELVASARLRRAQMRIEAMRPYADRMLELMAGTAQAAGAGPAAAARAAREVQHGRDRAGHRRPRPRRRVQRAGAAPRVRAACARRSPAGQEVRFFSSGKKAQSTLRFRRLEVGQSLDGFSDRPAYADAQAIAHALADAYIERRGRPGGRRLQRLRLAARAAGDGARDAADPDRVLEGAEDDDETRRMRGRLLLRARAARRSSRGCCPVYVETELYRALLESAASEQGARMTAMRNASKAAGELIDSAHARDEPRAAGRDHAGDPRGRRRRRRALRVGGMRVLMAKPCSEQHLSMAAQTFPSRYSLTRR